MLTVPGIWRAGQESGRRWRGNRGAVPGEPLAVGSQRRTPPFAAFIYLNPFAVVSGGGGFQTRRLCSSRNRRSTAPAAGASPLRHPTGPLIPHGHTHKDMRDRMAVMKEVLSYYCGENDYLFLRSKSKSSYLAAKWKKVIFRSIFPDPKYPGIY